MVIAWAVVAVGLGALAPKAEHALSGAGWEATGSESVAARNAIDASFAGQGGYALMVAVHGPGNLDATVAEATRILESDPRVSSVGPPAGLEGRTDGPAERRRGCEPDRDGARRGRPQGRSSPTSRTARRP